MEAAGRRPYKVSYKVKSGETSVTHRRIDTVLQQSDTLRSPNELKKIKTR
jgi:hypothetical protein